MKADDKIGVYPTTVVKSTEVTVYRVMIGECQLRFESEHLDDAQIFADGLRARQLANERKAADQPAPTPVPPEEQMVRGAEARLRELCGSVYQFIGANMHKLGGCRRFLDALSNASNGSPFDVEHLLPYDDEEPVCMTDVVQPASTEPKGADMAAEECEDLLIEEGDPLDCISCSGCNSRVREAFDRGESRAFARIRETARDVAVYTRRKEDESESKFVLRVLDEAARRLGIKP